MSVSRVMGLICLFLSTTGLWAADPIPVEKRIAAKVVGKLTVPGEQSMRMPTDVAVDSLGRVFVADGVNDRIVRFDPAGKFDLAITEIGGEKLIRPVGLTLDGQDRLWITDPNRHRLLLASRDGVLIERIDLPDSADGHPFDPTDVVVTPDSTRTYIVDNDNHRLVIRDNQTGRFTSFGRFGRGLGQFQWPFMLDIGPKGYVHVTEAVGARIQRISPQNRAAGQLGRWGVALGQLYRPKGIAIDTRGRVFVSDSSLGVVQAFSQRGRVEGVLTDAQGQPLRFEHPMGICFDRQGRLCVVELKANCVTVVSLSATRKSAATKSSETPTEKGGGR